MGISMGIDHAIVPRVKCMTHRGMGEQDRGGRESREGEREGRRERGRARKRGKEEKTGRGLPQAMPCCAMAHTWRALISQEWSAPMPA